jgi:hypothetical protein
MKIVFWNATLCILAEIYLIMKGSMKLKNELLWAERDAYWALGLKTDPTVFSSLKKKYGTFLTIFVWYWEMASTLDDPAFKWLLKDPTEIAYCKSILILKKSPLSEKLGKQEP